MRRLRRVSIAACALLATGGLLLLARHVSRETARLDAWVDGLDVGALPDAPPELAYREHRALAHRVLEALAREATALRRRRRFLDFASHELRTPLATASANHELTASLLARSDAGEGSPTVHDMADVLARPVARLGDALEDMRRLTTTLLWLARDERALPAPEPVDLLAAVRERVAARLHGTLAGMVEVELAGDAPGTNVRTLSRLPFELVVSTAASTAGT